MSRRKSDHLTDRQEAIARCMRRWVVDKGEYPTLREIGGEVGIASPATVHYQLQEMERLGAVARGEGSSRVYRLT
ncbi:LexA family protein [Streptomyces mirabilis]|uniref:LexA family protein n=1 Tax=Streptomyces mirabilis TaxID=68239 RepID=UPI003677DFB6